jgi:hypothetical protein
MAWYEILGQVLQTLLEYGALGILCILSLLFALRKDKEVKECRIEAVESERQHGKEKLQLERECRKENLELIRHYDKTLISVQQSVDSLVNEEDDE